MPKNLRTAYQEVGEYLKIGAVVRRFGVSASMLRDWENLGFVRPLRTDSGYRIYSTEDLRVLRVALDLRRRQRLKPAAIADQLRLQGVLNQVPARRPVTLRSAGPLLLKVRLLRGETLSTVAQAVEISVGLLCNIERSRSVSIGILRKLARYYDLNMIDLFSK